MSLTRLHTFALNALLIGALSLAVAGCGRRGKLEEPPDPATVAAEKAKAENGGAVEQQRPRRRKSRPIQAPDTTTPFDWLL